MMAQIEMAVDWQEVIGLWIYFYLFIFLKITGLDEWGDMRKN